MTFHKSIEEDNGVLINPIPPELFEGGSAWEGGRGGGKCPRPVTLKLLMIMK